MTSARVRPSFHAAVLVVFVSVFAFADTDVSGNWRVEFVAPNGEEAVNMTILQDGVRLTGRVVNEYGEYPIKGSIDGNQITVSWWVAEDGQQLEIVMKGVVSGETIEGTARLGNIGEGSLSARRVSRNP
jgi:hypothetical protein